MSAEAPAAGRSGFDRALILVSGVVVLGAIMSILDTTIVNIAIDKLSREFHTSLSTIQWVTTGYMLALATVIPLTGWAADRFGTKRLYLTSIVLFLAGSALSGAAWSAESLIVFRVLQGIGGGMILPAGMTILTQAAGPGRIGRVMSVVGVPMLMGPVIGPILGGWLVDDVSWRWIFYVNLPIGALALPFAWRVLPRDKPEPSQRLDGLGVVLLSPGLALLVYGLAETASSGGFGAKALVPLLAGVALLAAFAWHALRVRQPLIDLRLFSNRTVTAGAMTSFLFAIAFFGAMLLLPLYYQTVRGESALTAGLLLAPQGLGAAIAMPVSGKIVDTRGPGKVVIAGLGLIVLGMVSLTQLGATTSYWLLGATLFVLGLGMGGTMMPAMTAALQTLSRPAVPRATSALNIIQRVGGSLGTALLAVVLQHTLTSRIPGAHGGSGLDAIQSAGARASGSVTSTLAGAFGDTFWWAVALCALALLPALFLPRRPPAAEPTPAGPEAEVALPV